MVVRVCMYIVSCYYLVVLLFTTGFTQVIQMCDINELPMGLLSRVVSTQYKGIIIRHISDLHIQLQA